MMTDFPIVLNDALGITQYISGHLGVEEATTYLLAIEELSLEIWRSANRALPIPGTTERRTKEAYIKEILTIFTNHEIKVKYVIGNLSICPGLSPAALQLASYVQSQAYAVRRVAEITDLQARKAQEEKVAHNQHSSTSPTSSASRGEPPASQVRLLYSAIVGNNTTTKGLQAPPTTEGPFTEVRKRRNNRRANNNAGNWVFGEDVSEAEKQTPELVHLCLAVRSGPDETTGSLSEVVRKWTDLKETQVEAVTRTPISTTFRVQFKSPASLRHRWTESHIWPARLRVKVWSGNPNSQLKPLDELISRKKLYVGNLREDMTMNELRENMEKMYEDEMKAEGPIQEIEVLLNESAWLNQKRMRLNNPNHRIRKSACVVIHSKKGMDLSDLDMKLDNYPHSIRRAIRPWRGAVPWPADHEALKAPNAVQAPNRW